MAANSPAIGFADQAHIPATDLLGNPRDAQPDAGCYEYISATLLCGDVSGNGKITSYDASLAAQYAVGLITFEPDAVMRADVTGNSEVSSYDASLIAQRASGLIEKFPVEQ